MTSILEDLNFLDALFEEFFRKTTIRATFSAIRADQIRGWEKWLQIELAMFLRQHQNVKAWGRESQYPLDKRIAKIRSKCAVDFLIHQSRKHSHMAVEIKQLNATTTCISGMIKDIRKMNKIRGNEFDIRSVWALGIHNAADSDEVLRKVAYHASKLEIDIKPHLVATKKIGRTGFSYTLL